MSLHEMSGIVWIGCRDECFGSRATSVVLQVQLTPRITRNRKMIVFVLSHKV